MSCNHCLHAGGGRTVAPAKARQPALEESEDDEEEAAAQPAGNPTSHPCLLSLDAPHFIVELHAHCLMYADIHTRALLGLLCATCVGSLSECGHMQLQTCQQSPAIPSVCAVWLTWGQCAL